MLRRSTRNLLIAAAAVFGFGVFAANAQPPKSPIEGSWDVVEQSRGDVAYKLLPQEDMSGCFDAQGRTLRFSIESLGEFTENWTAKFTLDESEGAVDMTFTSGPEKGSMISGIFELSGDELRICLPIREPFLERPTVMNADPGSNRELFILRRVSK